MVSASGTPDVVIIGDGLIGLSTALQLGRAGVRTTVVGRRRDGIASTAAAGLLVPGIGDLPPAVKPFFMASLAMYPAFVAGLQEFDPALRIIPGVLERSRTAGDRMHPADGAIDNVRLLAAVERALAIEHAATVLRVEDDALSIEAGPTSAIVSCASGRVVSGRRIVLAAGAWSPRLAGLPRPLSVRPLKGQMLALGACPLSHSIMGDDVYLVPRGSETLVGATVEDAGFDTRIDPSAIDAMHRAALELWPGLRGAPVTRTWAGIRPATPDMLPIIGPEPHISTLTYACGHSKNGILLAPATAAAVTDVVLDRAPGHDLAPFRVDRWTPMS
ncbi:MAG TPA: FAD-dependent oxidoreductase [Gemmatimonadaceae bacterium]|nr:FAD-dependent oxidoreductase [Gemmatimonadaceae bacterium]